MEIKIKKLNENAIIPKRGSKQAAGYDIYACTNAPIVIAPHQTVKVGTGLSIEIPNGYFGAIFARSGLATKQGLRPANCVGVIDSDYRGEIMVALHNDSSSIQHIEAGDRIAQLVFHRLIYIIPDENGDIWQVVDDLSETDRGTGGFGSTGTN